MKIDDCMSDAASCTSAKKVFSVMFQTLSTSVETLLA